MGTIVRELLAELSAPPVLVYPKWDAVTDNSRPFIYYCYASVDGVGATLEQRKIITLFTPLCSSAAIPSSLNVSGPRSIWKREASSGASNVFAVTAAVPFSDIFASQGARKPRQDRRAKPMSTTVKLHPGISQRQCKREHRLSLPPAFACDGARPQ